MPKIRQTYVGIAALLFLMISVDSAYALTDITSCGTLSVPDEYRLINNIESTGDCLVIEAPNIEIDGNGYGIDVTLGNGIANYDGYDNIDVKDIKIDVEGERKYGIYMNGMDGGRIENVEIYTNTYFAHGINLVSCSNNEIISNHIKTYASAYGIYLDGSRYETISGNTFDTRNGYSIYIDPRTSCVYYDHDIDTTNTEDGRKIYYYYSPAPTVFSQTDASLVFVACANGFVIDNAVVEGDGIFLANNQNSIIRNSDIDTGNEAYVKGIELYYSRDVSILDNEIYTGGAWAYGVYLSSSTHAIVKNNDIDTADARALVIDGSNSTTFLNNYYDHDISNNLADGKQLLYYNKKIGGSIQNLNDVGQLYITNSRGVTIRNVNVTRDGISLGKTINSHFEDCNIDTEQYGIYGFNLYYSDNNLFENCKASTKRYSAIITFLYRSNGNEFINNIMSSTYTNSMGIYIYDADKNTFRNNDIITNGKNAYIVYIYSGEKNEFYDNKMTSYGSKAYGVFLDNSPRNKFSGNDIYTADAYAIYVQPSTEKENYNQYISTSNTEQGMKIYYYYDKKDLDINDISNIGQLYVANSRDIRFKNVEVMRDGIVLALTDDSVIENSKINTYYQSSIPGISIQSESKSNSIINCNIDVNGDLSNGIDILGGSDSTYLYDNDISVKGTGAKGCYILDSHESNITSNIIYTEDVAGNGIDFYSSSNNFVSDNKITVIGLNAIGFYLNNSNQGYFLNNDIITTGNVPGMSLKNSRYNNVTSFDFKSTCNYDYSIKGSGKENIFTHGNPINRTDITFDDIGSWFNYREDMEPNITLKMNVSAPVTISREVTYWDMHFIIWNETPSNIVQVGYLFEGLEDKKYTLLVTKADGTQTTTEYTTGTGKIYFESSIDSNTEFILMGIFDPPIVYVDAYPRLISSLGREYFNITCIDTGGGCKKTVITAGPYSCSVDHKDGLDDVCHIDLDDKCMAGRYTYFVDTVDDFGFHNTSVNGTFEYKKDDGCECLMNEECLNESCLDNYVCLAQIKPEVSFAINSSSYEIPLGNTDNILIYVKNPLNHYNIIRLSVFGNPAIIENWMNFDDTEGTNTLVRLEPNSEKYIPISVFGGKSGSYDISIFAASEINGLESSDTLLLNVISMDEESLSSKSPGIDMYGIGIILIIAVYIFLNQNKDYIYP